jgi:purine nucleosidase
MNVKRLAVRVFAAATSALAFVLLTLSLPVPLWRTGEHLSPSLVYLPQGLVSAASGPIWVDTDAACGAGRRRDPDDCLALVSLVYQQHGRIAGISTVFGNAPLETTDAVARALADKLGPDAGMVKVWSGCAEPVERCRTASLRPAAHDAIAATLRQRSSSFLALGPLTNLAAVLQREPDLAARPMRVIAVMGRRPGHLFHPAEGRGQGGILFGHGPVFRDLNAELDTRAVEIVLEAGIDLVLMPYAAARAVLLTEGDLSFIAAQGPAGAWVSERSRDWLDFWKTTVGIEGFYPFDLLTAAFVRDPSRFRCAKVLAWVGRDPLLPLYPRTPVLLVSQGDPPSRTPKAAGSAIYCDTVALDVRSLFTR